jgi:hypothetical protein
MRWEKDETGMKTESFAGYPRGSLGSDGPGWSG